MTDKPLPQKIAQYLGGGLVVAGVVGIGLLEMLVGATNPVTSDGQVAQEALVPLEVRSYIILAGILVWGVYAIYSVAAPGLSTADNERQRTEARQPE